MTQRDISAIPYSEITRSLTTTAVSKGPIGPPDSRAIKLLFKSPPRPLLPFVYEFNETFILASDLTYQANLVSFRDWPYSSPSKYQMAAAGFRQMRSRLASATALEERIYDSCILRLSDWQENDVPIEERVTRSPRCNFACEIYKEFGQSPKATTTAATSIRLPSLAPPAPLSSQISLQY